jgi:hypothetical protein
MLLSIKFQNGAQTQDGRFYRLKFVNYFFFLFLQDCLILLICY